MTSRTVSGPPRPCSTSSSAGAADWASSPEDVVQLDALIAKHGQRAGSRAFIEARLAQLFAPLLEEAEDEESRSVAMALAGWRRTA